MANFTVQVESGRRVQDGSPSVGPVSRSILPKDGFPPLDPDLNTSWDVFRIAVEKFPSNRMLRWREMKNGKVGPYLWKAYKEVYQQVLQVDFALSHLSVKHSSKIGIYSVNSPNWIVTMEALQEIWDLGQPALLETPLLVRVVSCTSFPSSDSYYKER